MAAMEVEEPTGEGEAPEADPLVEALEAADQVAEGDSAAAVDAYVKVLLEEGRFDDSAVRTKEQAVYRLAHLHVKGRDFDAVMGLLQRANPFFAEIAKAKTAKIVRTVIEIVNAVPDAVGVQIGLCEQVVAWCTAEKRSFLRQRVQSKLAALLLKNEQFQEALDLVSKLLRELKKLDDKQLLVETHLVEARIQHALRNVPKAKAALTTARTNGNAIYVAPLLQGEIDHMSGTLCCEEGDYNTAYSYFLESFEGFSNVHGPNKQGDPRSVTCLQHMMLCKVLHGAADEVPHIVSKWGARYPGTELEALAAIAGAAKKRSLEDFDEASKKFDQQLRSDVLVSHHLDLLYENLLENNLLKIIEPFSCVEIHRIAELIHLPVEKVEKKLSQMILDKKFMGTLDQGRGQLIVYEDQHVDNAYGSAVEVIANMESVVESLFGRARAIVS
eukprot:CAMPEP_0118973708 /NCGR_PEP_ID=MMETSP1173-20130426/10767_1 /TAXON_ID=1034831 /ORGANISM="Rhizochromulina marina cf, Strain CCMP1243" /LENGTH=442 /DNA_ID=CAMNT_0006923401 /DNA_START=24 /DNA_END=1352 /DNA_ORIENTATION=+